MQPSNSKTATTSRTTLPRGWGSLLITLEFPFDEMRYHKAQPRLAHESFHLRRRQPRRFALFRIASLFHVFQRGHGMISVVHLPNPNATAVPVVFVRTNPLHAFVENFGRRKRGIFIRVANVGVSLFEKIT